jgi:glucose-6-phosphate 1-dehydrogenase
MESKNADVKTGPCSFVIFGATGNLVTEKLLPALYLLENQKRISNDLKFVAFARREWSGEEWLKHMHLALQDRLKHRYDVVVAERLASRFEYVQGDHADPQAYVKLNEVLSKPREGSCENIVFYLAITPSDFLTVVAQLHKAGFSGGFAKHRIVVEKPFGEDIETAKMLNLRLHEHFSEEQIFRIDHYLGKETVQNLLVFRFANMLIEPIWNRNHIDHVQITVAEDKGIGSRAGYYDKTGALRDMLQNHLLQLLTFVAMEPPAILDADALRDEKVKVLRSIRPIPRRSVNSFAFRAQYSEGALNNNPVKGYQTEAGVEENSTTETFVAAKFYIDNWRWRGVPFYLRTGKRMPQSQSTIAIRFRHPPQQLFRETPLENLEPNWIVLSIQPHESMHMEIQAKQPGLGMNTRMAKMVASYRGDNDSPSDAYANLLLDVIAGDRSLFIRFDEVEWAWRVVDPILRQWSQDTEFIHTYPAGTWGPDESGRLFDDEDQIWRNTI